MFQRLKLTSATERLRARCVNLCPEQDARVNPTEETGPDKRLKNTETQSPECLGDDVIGKYQNITLLTRSKTCTLCVIKYIIKILCSILCVFKSTAGCEFFGEAASVTSRV